MKIENTAAQMRKGILELCILGILSQQEAYPSDIIDGLHEGGLKVVEGTIYPLLTRLKNAEILGYRWEESQSGPPRKYYHVTEKGKAFYEELLEHWQTLRDAVEKTTNKES